MTAAAIFFADIDWDSILHGSVSRDLKSTQALNGANAGPVVLVVNLILSINLFFPTTAPPITLPWPSINFVPECKTRSIPNNKGF